MLILTIKHTRSHRQLVLMILADDSLAMRVEIEGVTFSRRPSAGSADDRFLTELAELVNFCLLVNCGRGSARFCTGVLCIWA